MEAENQKIHSAMIEIMRSVEAIKKEKTNKQGEGFKYRGIDDVMNSLHASFAAAGVFIMPEVLERSERERQSRSGSALFYVTQKIKFTFIASDGSNVSAIVNGTAMDSGDKADNKSMSIGLKYALLQAFLIPTEDMAEPDGETHEVKPESKPKQPEPKPAAKVPVTQNIWFKLVERVSNGETSIIPQIHKTYILTEDQEAFLKQYEPKNTQQ